MKQIVKLQKSTKDNNVISDVLKDAILPSKYKKTGACSKALEIASQKVALVK